MSLDNLFVVQENEFLVLQEAMKASMEGVVDCSGPDTKREAERALSRCAGFLVTLRQCSP